MDIGRLAERISDDRYAITYLYRDKGKIIHKAQKIRARLHVANVDAFGHIYIPKELLGVGFHSRKLLISYVTPSLFGYLIAVPLFDPELAIKKIREMEHTKVAIVVERRRKRKLYERSIAAPLLNIKLKRFLIAVRLETKMAMRKRGKILNDAESESLSKIFKSADLDKKQSLMKEHEIDFIVRRCRLALPKFLLKYIGIDVDKIWKEKIAFIQYENTPLWDRGIVEIWEKNIWDSKIGKVVWLSNESKYIVLEKELGTKSSVDTEPRCSEYPISKNINDLFMERKKVLRLGDIIFLNLRRSLNKRKENADKSDSIKKYSKRSNIQWLIK